MPGNCWALRVGAEECVGILTNYVYTSYRDGNRRPVFYDALPGMPMSQYAYAPIPVWNPCEMEFMGNG
jgi:hypothetical protein